MEHELLLLHRIVDEKATAIDFGSDSDFDKETLKEEVNMLRNVIIYIKSYED